MGFWKTVGAVVTGVMVVELVKFIAISLPQFTLVWS